ncbi:MAG: TIGR00730 family Rossman fold protein [bacterium]|nr:TIGR00730 family Rossman fold protein [bacterium]
MKRICVYCGSSRRANSLSAVAAAKLGNLLAQRGFELVFGGSSSGTMGALSDAVLAAGGEVTGVIPGGFSPEIAHTGLTRLHVVDSMHERKALMAELADAFIALPGAYGTLDEFCEILAWAQLRIHRKPCGLLNVNGYFDSFLAFLDHAVKEDFLKPVHREIFLVETDAERLLDRIAAAGSD